MISAAVCLGWTAATSSVAIWAALRRRRERVPSRGPVARRAPFVLLRPCAGDEPDLVRALLSSEVVGVGGRVRFLVADPSDEAVPAAARASQLLRASGVEAHVVVTGACGPNRKADQLARALAAIPSGGEDEIVVVADSDVLLTQRAWDVLFDEVASGRCAAAWAPPVELSGTTLGDAVSAAVLDASMHSFGVLAALDPAGMVGKTFAVRRSALARTGGFGELIGILGEDMELARRMRASGLCIGAVDVPVVSLARGRSLKAVVTRYARWIAVIRAQRTKLLPSYPLLLATAPLQLGCALLAVALDGWLGILALTAIVTARTFAGMVARRSVHRSLFAPILSSWLADVVLLSSFVRALSSRDIVWRGTRLRIGPRGELGEVA